MARQSFPKFELALLCLTLVIPSDVEESLEIVWPWFARKYLEMSPIRLTTLAERRLTLPVDMTKSLKLIFVISLGVTTTFFAQESPTPTASPEESSMSSPTATISAAARNVPLRFVPPPMEGTISLGIWDSNDKLVRVLHREAKIDSFTVEENSLSTSWDGKNDAGEDLPAGKYRARGYLVGKLKVEDLGKAEALPPEASDHTAVKLVTNPLTSDTRAVMEVGVGFDSKGSFLRTTDGLPLATISEAANLSRVTIQKNGEKAADVWQQGSSAVEHVRVSNIDRLMAFDCGFFDLR